MNITATQKYTPLRVYITSLVFVFLLLGSFRLLFAFIIRHELSTFIDKDFLYAVYIGLKFDARLAALFTLPLAICYSLPFLTKKLTLARVFLVYLLPFFGLFSLYALDLGFYFYLGLRLNATLYELLLDMREAMLMVWQSYSIVLIGLSIAGMSVLFTYTFARITTKPVFLNSKPLAKVGGFFIGLILCFICIYGQISSNFFPLRWSNAYFTPDQHLVALALNPVQNLYDTFLQAGGQNYTLEKVQDAYPTMAKFLGVDAPDIKTFNFERIHNPAPASNVTLTSAPASAPAPTASAKHNVVIIIMESLAYPKTTFGADGPNTTPYLASLARESFLFHKFFANTRTTARAVFTIMTGIPDVNAQGTASRNPFVAEQHVIINEFAGYDKFYMIGGNANWANIRAVLGHNTKNLEIIEEEHWKAPNIDVWGISDYDLLQESHSRLAARDPQKPFVAVIQTAGYHKPFTIPSGTAFTAEQLTQEQIDYYGFDGQEEFASLQFADFSLGKFFEEAKKNPYYDNTIFFIFGDHGITDSGQNMPTGYRRAYLGPWHVPLLIHTSKKLGLVPTGETSMPASHVDVFPTVASLAGITYSNRTLGRDLFDTRFDKSRITYVGGQEKSALRLIMDEYCLFDTRGGQQFLFKLTDTEGKDFAKDEPQVFEYLRELAVDFEQTARYMLYNNKQK